MNNELKDGTISVNPKTFQLMLHFKGIDIPIEPIIDDKTQLNNYESLKLKLIEQQYDNEWVNEFIEYLKNVEITL